MLSVPLNWLKWFRVLLLCALFLAPMFAFAAYPLVLGDDVDTYKLGGSFLDILEDKSGKLTINDVVTPAYSQRFKLNLQNVPNFGMTDSAFWLRFTIDNRSVKHDQWLLLLDQPLIDQVDLYIPWEDGSFEIKSSGDMRPMSVREMPNRTPLFSLDAQPYSKTFYLRCWLPGRAQFPLTIYSPEAFQKTESVQKFVFGIHFGFMIAVTFIGLSMFVLLRDPSYLYFAIYVLGAVLMRGGFNGYVYEFVLSAHPVIHDYVVLIICPVALMAYLEFIRCFLDTKIYSPLHDRLLKGLFVLNLMLIPLWHVIPSLVFKQMLNLDLLIFTALTLSASIICYRSGYMPARKFLYSRIVLYIGAIISVLVNINIISAYFVIRNITMLTSVFEVVFVVLALADRINLMRQEKEQAEAEKFRVSHLATIGELAACVAHEINTPVNTIINTADLLLEYDTCMGMEQDVELIKKEGRRIAMIAKSLLFFTGCDEKNKIPFPVSDILRGTLDIIGSKLRKEKIELILHVPPDLREVLVFPQHIEQVFLNVMMNAIHALGEKHASAKTDKRLEIEASDVFIKEMPFVRITFIDNGVGISPSLIGAVKDRFVTTKKFGTGLGLSISQQIINEHGGTIDIESVKDEYTRVSIDLPSVINV